MRMRRKVERMKERKVESKKKLGKREQYKVR